MGLNNLDQELIDGIIECKRLEIQEKTDKLAKVLAERQDTDLPLDYYLAELKFQTGKKDRLLAIPCKSSNGAYLNGWYSSQDFYYISEDEFKCL